jgi:signal peptidase I
VTTVFEQQENATPPQPSPTWDEAYPNDPITAPNVRPIEAPLEAEPDLPRPRVRSRTLFNDIKDTIIMVVAIYTLVNLIAPRYIVEGASMQPNFETGEWIIVSRMDYLLGAPQRGDVVILDFPEPQEDLIKRVVGLPGETIAIHDQQVFVDGVPIDEPYINAAPRYTQEPITLGPNQFYVLGDNRNNSRDSHYFGPVDRDKVIGRAWLIYWPPPDWGFVQHYGYDGVPPAATTPDTATETEVR